MKKCAVLLAVLLGMLLAVACAGCDCNHEWGDWITVKEKTCLEDGSAKRVCKKCGEAETMQLNATGYHIFGEWEETGKYKQRACTVCGYKEQMENIKEEDVELVTGVYESFDRFLADCSSGSGEAVYSGPANSISVDLAYGTEQCDGYTIVIPKNVLVVKFIGRTQGTPFQNLRFVIAERASNLDITFEDVDIETNGTILRSESRKISVDITMEGTLCSFVNTSKGAQGADGAENSSGSPNAVIENGQNGEDGTPAFFVNGTCSVYCKSKQLVIKGGAGGNGGSGTWSGWPGKSSGNGGNGGNGGAAFQGDNTADLYVLAGSRTEISGGAGGNGGGAGGCTAAFNKKYGSDGRHGSDGGTGFGSPREIYE